MGVPEISDCQGEERERLDLVVRAGERSALNKLKLVVEDEEEEGDTNDEVVGIIAEGTGAREGRTAFGIVGTCLPTSSDHDVTPRAGPNDSGSSRDAAFVYVRAEVAEDDDAAGGTDGRNGCPIVVVIIAAFGV